jgi:3-dehydroquinate dehydratase/shikimate dehydrogenase
MGEFGLMSRVLAPKFNGFLTFASLRDQAATAPGQPTIDDLLGLYRFRSIGKATRLYGVIGWPVGHSLSPLIHNAGFAEIGWDGVYLPLPIAADENDARGEQRVSRSRDADRSPRIARRVSSERERDHPAQGARGCRSPPRSVRATRAASAPRTRSSVNPRGDRGTANTDADAIADLLVNGHDIAGVDLMRTSRSSAPAASPREAAAHAVFRSGATAVLYNRTLERAESMAAGLNATDASGRAIAAAIDLLPKACCHAYINCTPVGMTGGPDPEGLSIPIPDMTNIDEDTVFFDTVYNPVETPMLRAARERGCRTIDGVEMFVKQAAAQFELWTGEPAPIELFDRLCREKLGAPRA